MDKPNVPEHLQKALEKALHDIAICIHDETMMSVVIIEVKHASDAILGKSTTIVGGIVGGEQVVRGPKHPDNEPLEAQDKTAMVDDLVNRMMEQAKKGGNK